jgi:6-phosphogluconolactonase
MNRSKLAFPPSLILEMVVLLAGCGGGSPQPTPKPTPSLVSIQVTPSNPSVAVGAMQQFAAAGTFSDGSTQDLTHSAVWSSSETTATISSSGQATGVAIGRLQITATSGSISGSTTLIVVIGQTSAVPRFAYAANLVDNTISVYTVNGTTGQLRNNGYALASGNPTSVAVSPSGKFAYTADSSPSAVSAYSIDPGSSTLTAVTGSPFATGSGPNAVVVDPSDSFVYKANQAGNVSAFAISATSGALTAITGSPFSAGTQPVSLTVHPSGNFVYVVNASSNNIAAYSLDATTGRLAQIAGSPFPAGSMSWLMAADLSGQFVYVANQGGGVTAYTLDLVTGSLTAVTGSPFAAGTGPISVTTTVTIQ